MLYAHVEYMIFSWEMLKEPTACGKFVVFIHVLMKAAWMLW